MKRGGPLERRTPLKAKTPIRRPAAPKAKPRRKPRPGQEFWATQRAVLFGRSRGLCEHCGADLNSTGMEAHHRKLRSQGGGHGVENLVALCPRSHEWMHAHPVEATTLGFIVPSYAKPAYRAVVLHGGRTVRLGADGTYDECWTDEGEAA